MTGRGLETPQIGHTIKSFTLKCRMGIFMAISAYHNCQVSMEVYINDCSYSRRW
ncbi:MAG: hypothetical protein GX790_05740 [Syntrophomonadaceae bacterium]|nr:hypothetical protein [Syntrophomonadaceae bacterium]